MNDFILASASPRRRELLSSLGYEFSIVPSDVDEELPPSCSPDKAVEFLAEKKCTDVAELYFNDVVLGCDTIVVLNGKILGKPHDEEEAFAMLKALSGNTHSVYTGVCIAKGEKKKVFSVETKVRFYDLDDDLIHAYISSGEPMDKAGAYGIQQIGSLLVESINGDYFTVVGLPLSKTARELADFGIFSHASNVLSRKD